MWTILGASPALGCGGFFCNQAAPVVQAGEEIVFVVDETTDTIEMHVEVTYDGPSEDFAWIVPVPQTPEILVGTSALFERLAAVTRPRWLGQTIEDGYCRKRIGVCFFCVEYAMGESLPPMPSVDGASAPVAVGPYETVTLQAPTSDTLMQWLVDFGYDATAVAPELLAPYVQSGSTFVALRLAKGNDTGDLVPLVLRYPATRAAVPVTLTALAAADEMPLEVYVLSRGRAVPESYLHVQRNMAAIDWPSQGSNATTIVEQAADEAGGHAFATDFHGSTGPLAASLFDADRFDEGALRAKTEWVEWVNALKAMLPTPPSDELLALLADLARVPEDVGDDVWSCPECLDVITPDIELYTDRLMAEVVPPLANAQAAIDSQPRLTRLVSALDAGEMTVDPTFVINQDLDGQEIARDRTTTLIYDCGNGRTRDGSDRRLDLPDGRSLLLPTERWMSGYAGTDAELLAPHGEPRAQVIEQLSESGPGEVLFDSTPDLLALAEEHNAWVRSLGCGCRTSGAGGLTPLATVAMLLLARRRVAA